MNKLNYERKIKLKSFKLTKNPQVGGCSCAFNEEHFIDYLEECYIHPELRIIICKKCRNERANKYLNVKKDYGGITYHSTLEAEFAEQLDLQLRAGQIKEWSRQKRIEINVKLNKNGEPVLTSEPIKELKDKGIEAYHITNYYMDFVVVDNNGGTIFYECKGLEMQLWKIKFRLTEMIFRDKVRIEVIKKSGYKPKRKKNAQT